ncbi:MAG: 30S ribosomal protein S12 methylthiotransferase RimO [Treponema sp.]|nr:30S ribosomal protein S12 methylthiotransferase RimO [Treponema sp.]
MTSSKSYSFFIDQHGCAKNQVDGEILIGHLEKAGHKRVDDASLADIIIINSCGFIQSAKEESLGSFYDAKKAYPDKKVVMTGCLSERYADLFDKSMPEMDGIFGNGKLSDIVDFVEKTMEGSRPKMKAPQNSVCGGDRPFINNFAGSAYVKITEGCSNHCTFCAIPLIRGELRSRKMTEIIAEIKELLARGVYEINLIGQDLAAYGTGETDTKEEGKNSSGDSPLKLLLEKICKTEGDFVIRLLYIHPDHFPMDILPLMQKDSRILHYFDIPFQSGDDQIIKSMNRKGTAESYAAMIEKIRQALPDVVIRTTFMAGFPGEGKKNFLNTVKFLKTISPNWSGTFAYSREDDTPAYNMKKQNSYRKSQKRADILHGIQEEITFEKLKGFTGKKVRVLIEEIIPNEDEGIAIGRGWFQAPDVDGSIVLRYENDDPKEASLIKEGKVVSASILGTAGVDLDARLIVE